MKSKICTELTKSIQTKSITMDVVEPISGVLCDLRLETTDDIVVWYLISTPNVYLDDVDSLEFDEKFTKLKANAKCHEIPFYMDMTPDTVANCFSYWINGDGLFIDNKFLGFTAVDDKNQPKNFSPLGIKRFLTKLNELDVDEYGLGTRSIASMIRYSLDERNAVVNTNNSKIFDIHLYSDNTKSEMFAFLDSIKDNKPQLIFYNGSDAALHLVHTLKFDVIVNTNNKEFLSMVRYETIDDLKEISDAFDKCMHEILIKKNYDFISGNRFIDEFISGLYEYECDKSTIIGV